MFCFNIPSLLISFLFLGFFAWTSHESAYTQEVKNTVPQTAKEIVPFYIGTYTQGVSQSQGIYLSELNTKDGSMKKAELAIPSQSPAFLVRHPQKATLYAVSETWNAGNASIYAFSRNTTTSQLTLLGEATIPGKGPTHLNVHCDPQGDTLVVANYGSGNVVSLPINDEGGLGNYASSIQHHGSGPNLSRQKEPHPHGVYTVPFSKQILVPDLGIDKLMMYEVDPVTAKIAPDEQKFLEFSPGCGPRHLAFAFGPQIAPYVETKTLYVINELNSTICVVSLKAMNPTQNSAPSANPAALTPQVGVVSPASTEVASLGAIAPLRWSITQTVSTLPQSLLDAPEQLAALKNTTAEIAVHPSGRFVYASNRGADTITVFSVAKETGQLTQIQSESTRGKTPRHFAISPCGHFLLVANQDSNTIFSFQIHAESGKLAPIENGMEVPSPVCITF